MYFVAGLMCGIGATLCTIGFLLMLAKNVRRKKLANATGLVEWMRSSIKNDGTEVNKLINSLSEIGPVQIEFNAMRRRPLTNKEMGFVMLLRGVDTLLRQSNIPWTVVDGVIQRCTEYSLAINNQNAPEPGKEQEP